MMCRRLKSVASKLSLPVLPENFSEFAYRLLSWLVWNNRSLTDTIFHTEEWVGMVLALILTFQLSGFGDVAFFFLFFALKSRSP
jgi:hypothetical protein